MLWGLVAGSRRKRGTGNGERGIIRLRTKRPFRVPHLLVPRGTILACAIPTLRWFSLNFPLTQPSKLIQLSRVKAIVTIFFSLALVLSHLTAFASPVQLICQSGSACGCGASGCCMKQADSAPAPVAPASAPATSQTQQLLAAFQAIAQFVLIQPEAVVRSAFLPAPPVSADVPLYLRNCSYLI